MFCCLYHMLWSSYCAPSSVLSNLHGVSCDSRGGKRVIEESFGKELFAELWAASKEPTGAGIAQESNLKVQGEGQALPEPSRVKT